MVRLLPGVVGQVVDVGEHLRLLVLRPLQGPVVENVKVVRKEVEEEVISNSKQMLQRKNTNKI